ncbi:MAG: hypothetical protein JST44_26425 [Cyanobacteria bacterium SZAS LIN-5]|nr:hypothetical protein [Cyanobacteria bacterium SZAS LIN-5]RTL45869.1 MAG: hypothetical protein EKK48_00565 [Candidatus Melainabacteria bacterium]
MNRPLRSSSANSSRSVQSSERMQMLLLNMGLVLFVICMSWWGLSWMLSDVTGEYSANDARLGIVRMSLVRRAANIKGELSYGSGALLEMTTPKLEPDTQIDLTFELPQRWVDQGQEYRAVHFHGTIKDGTASGVIRDGAQVFPVKLEKNSIASVYRQIQSHLPFSG